MAGDFRRENRQARFLKSVEWAAFQPSYNQARKRAQNVSKGER
jgi:hypothetical protein